ncbi:uncharacterized protein LOC121387095 isoform X2 [Gigantopelta aegis]|nr:uncharacterized protein LOC121387095 isoform X2 [Gigantopelta aegis]
MNYDTIADLQSRKQWVSVNSPKGHCRVPFVKNVTLAVGPITKYDGTILCECDFCYFDKQQAVECRRTGTWTPACGGCQKIEWRHFNIGTHGPTLNYEELPTLITPGFSITWRGKPSSPKSSFSLYWGAHFVQIDITGINVLMCKVDIKITGTIKKVFHINLQSEVFEITMSVELEYVQVTVHSSRYKFLHNLKFFVISGNRFQINIEGNAYTESLKYEY